MPPSRFRTSFKAAYQVGFTQLVAYAWYKVGLMSGTYRKTRDEVNASDALMFSPLFSPPDHIQLTQILGEAGRRALLAEANEILAGKFRMFGGELTNIELKPVQPLAHWTEYETQKESLSSFAMPHNDIKFLWEPARFGWAFPLGRAYTLTQKEIFAEAFWKYFEQFTDANPPNMGPHWMNGQEVAIRLMALVWAGQVFEKAACSHLEKRARLARVIAEHAVRIPPTLVYARAQNNNHLIVEAAGLYTAGRALNHQGWRATGWHWLNWAFQHQISGYGEYIQHSTNYHRVMLQSALWIHAIKDKEWPRATLQLLEKATHWLFSMLDPVSGKTPNLGANDGALIFPLSTTPFNDFRSTVQAAARAFLRYQMPGGAWDEFSLWLGLKPQENEYESTLYLTDHLRGQKSWGYLRASTFPSRLGHMDQLHFDLWWRGLNIAQDAGTYLYNAAPPWDNPLVTGRVHNIVIVDHRDLMTRGGRFLTLDWFPAYIKSVIPTDESVLGCVQAYHKRYSGILHERKVTVYANERWLVEDKLVSRNPHIYRLHWLLPDWEWKIEGRQKGVEIELNSPHGKISLVIKTDPVIPDLLSMLTLIRAGKLVHGASQPAPYEGWSSPAYGTKIPALSLSLEAPASQGVTFSSDFIFPA